MVGKIFVWSMDGDGGVGGVICFTAYVYTCARNACTRMPTHWHSKHAPRAWPLYCLLTDIDAPTHTHTHTAQQAGPQCVAFGSSTHRYRHTRTPEQQADPQRLCIFNMCSHTHYAHRHSKQAQQG